MSSTHQDLLDKATAAINALFGDRSVAPTVTAVSLYSLVSQISTMAESLEEGGGVVSQVNALVEDLDAQAEAEISEAEDELRILGRHPAASEETL